MYIGEAIIVLLICIALMFILGTTVVGVVMFLKWCGYHIKCSVVKIKDNNENV